MFNLCCIANHLPYKTVNFSHFRGYSHLYGIWRSNFETLNTTLSYCADNGWGLRVSSSLMPLCTHPEVNSDWSVVSDAIKICAETIKKRGIRVSMHPGPYCVLESDNSTVVENTIRELNWHGWLMDELGAPRDYYAPINTHIYTSKGDIHGIAGRFIRGFLQLDDSVKSRLVVENNDKGGVWSCAALLSFREMAAQYIGNIPITFDILHDQLLPSTPDAFKLCYDTWPVKPIFHYSESEIPGTSAHANLPTKRPFSDIVDWDIELKGKDAAIKHFNCLK